jgi:hypothetical protein
MSIRFKKTVRLAGIVYLHRISDNRLRTSVLENVEKLVALCGDNTIVDIVLATTMWNTEGSPELKIQRETELETLLNEENIVPGTEVNMMRFGDSFISAWHIIDRAAKTDEEDMDEAYFQQDLAELGEKLSDDVGKEKFQKLQSSLTTNRDILRRLLEGESDEQLLLQMNVQYEDLRKTLQDVFDYLSHPGRRQKSVSDSGFSRYFQVHPRSQRRLVPCPSINCLFP